MDTMTYAAGPSGPAPAPLPTTSSETRTDGPRGRVARLWRGDPSDPTWARPSLLLLLLATAAFYFWNLTSSGWANSFYSAAAQAGSESWTALFYGSSDASNAITVDKPPASIWVMALSVRLLGLNSFAILAPQVLMGVAAVGVLHATVKRHFGAAAGLLAGAVLALTPVAVLMFRFNNPDALLVLLMTLAAWATVRAVDAGSTRWFVLAGVFLGFGFLTKTLQVLLVIPFLGLAFLVAADTTLRRRIIGSVAGAAAFLLTAGWWVAIVELVPESMRPYIGGSQTNSFLELTFGYNGLGRINGNETGSVGGGNGWGETGLGRIFNASIGGQISWLIPTAVILLIAGLALRGLAPRTDRRRASYIVWGGWLLVTLLTFSLMAGIFHEYYTVALAPAVAALVGMGAKEAWENRANLIGAFALAAATGAAALWGFVLLGRTSEYDGLKWAVLFVGLAAAFGMLVLTRLPRRGTAVVSAAAIAAGLAGPAAYSLTTVSEAHTGSIVTAGPATMGGRGMGGPGGIRGQGFPGGSPGQAPPGMTQGQVPQGMAQGQTQGGGGMGGLLDAGTPSTEVIAALSEDAESYRWVAAAVGSQSAAGLQLGTELPVMAIGGFNGSDPSPTLEQFQQYVADGDIHYLAASGGGMGGRGGSSGGSSASSEITTWVSENFTSVTIDGSTFYDLTQPLDETGAATATSSTSNV
ncbi:ArnT family glycosyltransferase [Janibacter sp. G56]|uniref:ArnT family glycosyltransferase n=1 Tax=Janibacter sp. G56 TaxID=3418717 RepID=UPI003CFF36B9